MYRTIMKLVAVLRIIVNGRCWSKEDSVHLNEMLDMVLDECRMMEDD